MNEWILLTLTLSLTLGFWLGAYWRKENPAQSDSSTAALADDGGVATRELYEIAETLAGPMDQIAHPRDALELPEFKHGVALLSNDAIAPQQVLTYLTGNNWILCCLAGEALCQRGDAEVSEAVLPHLRHLGILSMYFALKYLRLRHPGPLIGPVLIQAS